MKFENVVSKPSNLILLADKEWYFKTDDNRPALVRISQEKLILFIGARGKKHVYDGEFIESWSCKLDEKNVSWEMVENRLKSLTITIADSEPVKKIKKEETAETEN